MSKKLTKLVLFFFIAVSLSSCVATHSGYQASSVMSRDVKLDPIKADIIVNEDEKLSGQSTAGYVLFFRVSGDKSFTDGITYTPDGVGTNFVKMTSLRMQKARNAAAYKAISTGDYDVLVNPKYTCTIRNYVFYKEYSVSVEGYGAKYTNFRTEKQKIIITNQSKEYVIPDTEE